MLWSRAIPAKQRFKEIEEGAKREFVETIRDPSEIQRLGFDLIRKAEEEILLLFSTANAFRRQEKAGALDILKEVAKLRGVKVRILVPIGNNDKKGTVSERIHQMKEVKKLEFNFKKLKQFSKKKKKTLIEKKSFFLTLKKKFCF